MMIGSDNSFCSPGAENDPDVALEMRSQELMNRTILLLFFIQDHLHLRCLNGEETDAPPKRLFPSTLDSTHDSSVKPALIVYE